MDVGRTKELGAALAVTVAAVTAAAHAPASASPSIEEPELRVMNADGTDQRVVGLYADEYSASISWSPDGTHIAFDTSRGVEVADVETGSALRVTDGQGADWSPDGTALALLGAVDGRSALVLASPDGSGRRVLRVGVGPGYPAWSPDGALIAFHSCDEPPGCEPDLSVIAPDGSGEKMVAEGVTLARPSWSPDGSSLAYVSANGGVYVADVDSGATTEIFRPADHLAYSVAWGPGNRIAFTAWNDAMEQAVWLVEPDGTDSEMVHPGSSPQWSPGGTLAFVYRGAVRVHVPGTEGAPSLTPDARVEFFPTWSPDGESIAYLSQEPWPAWPTHDRAVGVTADGGRIRVKVEVAGGYSPCKVEVPVRLERLTSDGWVTEERARTDERGRARWRVGARRGTYRVRSPGRYTGYPGDSDKCGGATSARFRLRG